MHRRILTITLGACLCLAIAALPAAAQAPMRVGDEYRIHVDSLGGSDMDITPTEDGRVYTLTHTGATYIALYFADFDLAPGEYVRITDANGRQDYVMSGHGKMEAGTFWSQHVKGDTIRIHYVTSGEGKRLDKGFLIDKYTAGFVDLGEPDGGIEATCGTNDKGNAACYETSHPTEYDRGRAVARLLINGGSLCTGWLASAADHLVTNNHCIGSASSALNTDYEFMSEAPDCGSSNCQLCHDGVVISGANFIQTNGGLDYTLVQITSGNPAATYGFLQIDDRAAVLGEEIYIPQHAGGRAKEFGIFSTHTADGPSGVCHVNQFSSPCSGSGYQDVGYMCDTEGGSSGSPVLARSSHKVIALHHCANCPNRGVPIDLVCDEICQFLSTPCTSPSDCDDGQFCNGAEVCSGGFCEGGSDPCPGEDCDEGGDVCVPIVCDNDGTCEDGEDCNGCPNDCISGSTSASCGNNICEIGAGEDCLSCPSDCNGAPERQSLPSILLRRRRRPEPAGLRLQPVHHRRQHLLLRRVGAAYCCGDGVCEGDENSNNCDVDCDPGGSCAAKGDSCSSDGDCCSLVCKKQRHLPVAPGVDRSV